MTDVLIIGAGPTGATMALAFAQKGARVLLAEGNPKAARRFAGEWMHPPGVRMLTHLGIDASSLSRAGGKGFVLISQDEEPIELPYDRGTSLARVHHELVEELRELAASHPLVDYRPGVSFVRFEGHSTILADTKSGQEFSVRSGRVMGADGRNSKVRAALGASPSSSPISYMMGVDLKDCRLPHEGLGHVVAGGPGPALLYRVDDSTIRACLDVPNELGSDARKKEAIWQGFRQALPTQLQEAFRNGLSNATPWAATRFQARSFFGKGRVWLAGDAVGHLHPVTGMGMTLGILDAVAAAECNSLEEYQSRRESYVVELLTNALYHVVQRKDDSAARIRSGLFEMLRKDASERRRTMRILTGEDERRSSFFTAFMKASGYTLSHGFKKRDYRGVRSGALVRDLTWLKWPMSALVPSQSATAVRSRSSFSEPLPLPRTSGLRWPVKAPTL